MLISVIVPVYQVERYLPRCIESICHQTYKDLEIILVDDGSPDNCGAICDEYAKKDTRIRVIHQQNGGLAIARNSALDICTGEYIAFVDSDDEIKADMIEKLVAAANSHQSDMTICGVVFRKDMQDTNYDFLVKEERVVENPELMHLYLNGGIFSGMCNKLYHRTLFQTIRFPALRSSEDVYTLPELIGSCRRCTLIPDCLYVQNIREGSIVQSKVTQAKIDATLSAIEHRMEYVRAEYPNLISDVALDPLKMHYNLLKMLIAQNHSNPKEKLYREQYAALVAKLRAIDETVLGPKQQMELQQLKKVAKSPGLFYWYRRAVLAFRTLQTYLKLR